jgi:HlyD family secretion protein
MRRRNKNLLLLAVVVSGIALTAPEFGPKFRADELHPATSGSPIQGGAAQRSSTQDSPAQGSSTQGSWDAVTLGRVEPRSGEIKIAAPLPGGRIADVLVKANEEVFAGELLVRLDDDEALARVAEADAQVALHKRARNDQSAPAASADRRKAEDAAAESKLKASADTPLPTRLEGELNVAQAEWRVAQAAFEKTQIRAPADGVVLRVDAKKGELGVPSLQPALVIIGDVSVLRVRAEVNEQDLGRIRGGQSVLVRAAAFRGREFDGKVSSVARIVAPSRINSGDPRKFNDIDVLEVLVDLPDPGPLVVGEQVDVYFKSEHSDATQ